MSLRSSYFIWQSRFSKDRILPNLGVGQQTNVFRKRKKTANPQSDQKQLMTDQVRTEQEEIRRSDRRIYSSVPPPGQTRACSATKDSTSGENNVSNPTNLLNLS